MKPNVILEHTAACLEGRIHPGRAIIAQLLVGLVSLASAALAAPPQLHIQSDPTGVYLVVGPVPDPGALFVYDATNLASLVGAPQVLLATNAPLNAALPIQVPMTAGHPTQFFFRAAQWPGRTIADLCALAPALVDIPAGTFLMGSPATEPERADWEGPQTRVTLTYAFRMGKYEVQQAEYQAVMGTNPSYYAGHTNRPVEQVTWDDAMEYCRRLTEAQRSAGCLPAGRVYRLPTGAEWEYACRAGTTNAFGLGLALRSGMANFDAYFEYDESVGTIENPSDVFLDRTTSVGSYAPNAWGLYDMHGNVWEWCLDGWSSQLSGRTATDPYTPSTGTDRVIRGGCWYDSARFCRSAYRLRATEQLYGSDLGFRVVLAPAVP
jgi:formylglycine-generating enzyme required for sulfatase activity